MQAGRAITQARVIRPRDQYGNLGLWPHRESSILGAEDLAGASRYGVGASRYC
jgi:hypothetical protein